MPRKLSRGGRLSTLTIVAVLAFAAVPAAASATECEGGQTMQAFARWDDLNDYYLAPNGSFEDEAGWFAQGSVKRDNEVDPFNIIGITESFSLRLKKDGVVTTPQMCVSADTPHLRFLAKSHGSGQLDVEVRVWEQGKVVDSSSGSISPSDHVAWAPSRFVDLKVDKLAADETGNVTVTFKSQGDWLIDDVMVDPLRRG